jgi:uncharacterized phiE125 gp8 family phage protein
MIEADGYGAMLDAALAPAKALMRIDADDEDALIAGLIASAMALCEQFTGTTILQRSVTETVPARPEWRRLGMTPVAVIDGIEGLPMGGYAIDIDGNGDGWVRVTGSLEAEGLATVSYIAGLSESWSAVPPGLQQGVLRLAAHLHAHRDGAGDPPAAVAALWRPWRRMRLGEHRR